MIHHVSTGPEEAQRHGGMEKKVLQSRTNSKCVRVVEKPLFSWPKNWGAGTTPALLALIEP